MRVVLHAEVISLPHSGIRSLNKRGIARVLVTHPDAPNCLRVVRSFAVCVDPALPAAKPALPADPLRVRAGGGVLLLRRRLLLLPPKDGLLGTRGASDNGTAPANIAVAASGGVPIPSRSGTPFAAAAAAAAMFMAVPCSRSRSASEKVMPHRVVSSSVDIPSITDQAFPRGGNRKDSPAMPPP